ncbi:MAG: DNA double-strand break repair nuclease NurA [Candidatus Altiarchaeota archaeon]
MRHYSLWMDKYSLRRKQITDKFDELRGKVSEIRMKIPEEDLFCRLDYADEDKKHRMAFIDGGEGIRELMGVGIYFIRASGLLLTTNNGSDEGELFERDLDLNMIDYDENLKDRVELLREGMEFDVALQCAKKHRPEYVFLDGSLYVKARRQPVKCGEYMVYRKKFVRLLKYCKDNDIHLIGVSEDSKSKLMLNYLSSRYGITFPDYMTDSTILRILSGNKMARTIQFTPKSRFEADDRITSTLTATFPTAYIQPTEIANPMRIDAPDWEQDFDYCIRLIATLSKGSKGYGYPIPLYIAHLDARIKSSQTEWTATQIANYVSKKDPLLGDAIMRKTRRILRPI